MSYVCAGTFKLIELHDNNGSLDLPFNKAEILEMPFFTLEEMGKLFNLYKQQCDPVGLSRYIQNKIVDESSGHTASFMILLKLAFQRQPDDHNRAYMLEKNLTDYMNGTHVKVKQTLDGMSAEEKAYVRDLTKNQMNTWKIDPGQYHQFHDLIKYLLNIGVLVSTKEMVRFTSGILLRVCINSVWPRQRNPLSKKDIRSPVNLLELGLQKISAATIVDSQVQNKHGPQESSFQSALFSAFNSILQDNMVCLFETRAAGWTQLDLMVTDSGKNWISVVNSPASRP